MRVELAGGDTHLVPEPCRPLPLANCLAAGAEHLHACGPRAVAEFLAELTDAHGIEADTLDRLAQWRRLSPDLVRCVLDRWCSGRQRPPVLQEVPR